MKKVLVLVLVLFLLAAGLPLAMGMADMGTCPACSAPDAPVAMTMCLAILTMGLSITLAVSGRISPHNRRTPLFLVLLRLDRPPQHA